MLNYFPVYFCFVIQNEISCDVISKYRLIKPNDRKTINCMMNRFIKKFIFEIIPVISGVLFSNSSSIFLCWAYRTYSNRMISSIVELELSVLPQYPRDVWRDFYRHIKEINILELLYSHDVKQSAFCVL